MKKLGCAIPHRTCPHRRALLPFEKYFKVFPKATQSADWTPMVTVPFGAKGNDTHSCCVYSDTTHTIMVLTGAASDLAEATTDETLAMYSRDTGYNPDAPLDKNGDNPTDNGADPIVAMQDWMTKGFIVGGKTHKIEAFVQIDPTNHDHIKAAIDLFGHVRLCWNFGDGWMDAVVWDVDNYGAPDEGHDTPAYGYDDAGIIIVTWGEIRRATWAAVDAYADLALVAISRDWIDATGQSPAVFDYATLLADLKGVQN